MSEMMITDSVCPQPNPKGSSCTPPKGVDDGVLVAVERIQHGNLHTVTQPGTAPGLDPHPQHITVTMYVEAELRTRKFPGGSASLPFEFQLSSKLSSLGLAEIQMCF